MNTEDRKTSKRFRCVECKELYVSPIPVLEVQHDCKTVPVPGKKRKGMLPE